MGQNESKDKEIMRNIREIQQKIKLNPRIELDKNELQSRLIHYSRQTSLSRKIRKNSKNAIQKQISDTLSELLAKENEKEEHLDLAAIETNSFINITKKHQQTNNSLITINNQLKMLICDIKLSVKNVEKLKEYQKLIKILATDLELIHIQTNNEFQLKRKEMEKEMSFWYRKIEKIKKEKVNATKYEKDEEVIRETGDENDGNVENCNKIGEDTRKKYDECLKELEEEKGKTTDENDKKTEEICISNKNEEKLVENDVNIFYNNWKIIQQKVLLDRNNFQENRRILREFSKSISETIDNLEKTSENQKPMKLNVKIYNLPQIQSNELEIIEKEIENLQQLNGQRKNDNYYLIKDNLNKYERILKSLHISTKTHTLLGRIREISEKLEQKFKAETIIPENLKQKVRRFSGSYKNILYREIEKELLKCAEKTTEKELKDEVKMFLEILENKSIKDREYNKDSLKRRKKRDIEECEAKINGIMKRINDCCITDEEYNKLDEELINLNVKIQKVNVDNEWTDDKMRIIEKIQMCLRKLNDVEKNDTDLGTLV